MIGIPLCAGANEAPRQNPNTAIWIAKNDTAFPNGKNVNNTATYAVRRDTTSTSSRRRHGWFDCLSRAARIDSACRFRPSNVNNGKNNQPCRFTNHPAKPSVRCATIPGVNAIAPAPMSGSYPSRFGPL